MGVDNWSFKYKKIKRWNPIFQFTFLLRSNGRGPHLELMQEPYCFSPFQTPIAASLLSWDRRLRARAVWRNGTLLASQVVHEVTGHLSSCMWNLWVFPDDARGCQCPFVLWLHPQGCLRRGVRAWVLVKRGPENRGLLACGTTHEATSRISSWDWAHPEVRWEGRESLPDKAG